MTKIGNQPDKGRVILRAGFRAISIGEINASVTAPPQSLSISPAPVLIHPATAVPARCKPAERCTRS